ncbi:Biotin/lipoyl attachment [Artemisia annua]|uniref:Biotin/lipoyl attachment n=1 Tax=Artemisia annua TaxID=35608 RepID=A0A2U1QE30_ARTAN|nr:Biotin/lipoyl attachment [Artemisia annua]
MAVIKLAITSVHRLVLSYSIDARRGVVSMHNANVSAFGKSCYSTPTKRAGMLVSCVKTSEASGDVIKEGKTICYLDQFGTELPVKSDVDGEVIKILFDDGEAVGYGDPLIAVLPSFHDTIAV